MASGGLHGLAGAAPHRKGGRKAGGLLRELAPHITPNGLLPHITPNAEATRSTTNGPVYLYSRSRIVASGYGVGRCWAVQRLRSRWATGRRRRLPRSPAPLPRAMKPCSSSRPRPALRSQMRTRPCPGGCMEVETGSSRGDRHGGGADRMRRSTRASGPPAAGAGGDHAA